MARSHSSTTPGWQAAGGTVRWRSWRWSRTPSRKRSWRRHSTISAVPGPQTNVGWPTSPTRVDEPRSTCATCPVPGAAGRSRRPAATSRAGRLTVASSYYRNETQMMAVSVDTRTTFAPKRAEGAVRRRVQPSLGHRCQLCRPPEGRSVSDGPAHRRERRLHRCSIVTNWFADLRRLDVRSASIMLLDRRSPL